MAKETKETKIIHLFYDGDKYKDPVFVGINGNTWAVKRGEDVEVPIAVARVLENAERQNNFAEKINTMLMQVQSTDM